MGDQWGVCVLQPHSNPPRNKTAVAGPVRGMLDGRSRPGVHVCTEVPEICYTEGTVLPMGQNSVTLVITIFCYRKQSYTKVDRKNIVVTFV